MGRPRTATATLELIGAFKKNPQRARKDEPKPAGSFPKTPPRHLSDAEKKMWKEIVKAVPTGVLTSSDVLTVEIVAKLYSEFRTEGVKMPAALITRMAAEMGKLGLSPSDRAKLSVDKEPEKNPFDDF